jgi:DNA-binding NtrC family response regulator
MDAKPVLIVDDEKNIRLTLSQALGGMPFAVETAVNGEEALAKMEEREFALALLDLKMPGLDGMEVLRRIRNKWPTVRVIIITAYGTIESAVEAMKLGALDFIQKPFSPKDIRDLVNEVLAREALDEAEAEDYPKLIELSKRHITDRHFQKAEETVRKAVAKDPAKPEAYNLLGVLSEIRGKSLEAQKFYRAALDIDPKYKVAWANLDRITSLYRTGEIQIEEEKKELEETEGNQEKGNG